MILKLYEQKNSGKTAFFVLMLYSLLPILMVV